MTRKENRQSYRWEFKNKKEIVNQWMDKQTNTSLSLQVLVMNFIDRYGYVDVTDYDVIKTLNLDTERLKYMGNQSDKEILAYQSESPSEAVEEKSPEGDDVQMEKVEKRKPGRPRKDYSKVNLDNL